MSYSNSVKKELYEIENVNDCCMLSQISGIVKMIGNWKINEDNSKEIIVRTENNLLVDIYTKGINKFYGIDVNVNVVGKSARGRRIYELVIPNDSISEDLVEDIDAVIPDYYKYSRISSGKCCIKAFLRGSFLASGSINNPKKNYHLEISARDDEAAGILCAFFGDFGLNPKIILRKGLFVVYIKEADEISTFLNIIGAYKSLLDFENIRIVKDMRNNVNRAVNCETANINKTLNASFKQIEAIDYISKTKGLSFLPDKLKQVATLRLENPDLTLAEIGKLANPSLSKSGVNHRMKKIIEIAENLKNFESEGSVDDREST